MARPPSRNQTTLKNSKVLRRTKHLKKQKGKVAFAGVRRGATYVDGTLVASIMSILEFGADFIHPGGTAYMVGADGKAIFVANGSPGARSLPRTQPHRIVIPPRPVLRLTAATRSKAWMRQFAALMRKEGCSAERALAQIAELMAGDIRNAISSATGNFEDNAPSTIAAKGFNAPLRGKTKTLFKSIDGDVRDRPEEQNIKAGSV